MDTHTMMAFLYETIPPGDRKSKPVQPDDDENDRVALPEEIVELATLAETTRTLFCMGRLELAKPMR